MTEYDYIKGMYDHDEEFRDYVNRYANQYQFGQSIPVEDALEHAIVKEYALWLIRKRN